MSRTREHVTTTSASALIDVAIVIGSMALAYWLRFVVFRGTGPMGTAANHVVWCAAFSPVYLFLYSILGLYDHYTSADTTKVMGRLILANTIGMMIYIDIIFVFRMVDFSRWMIVLAWVITNVLGCVKLAVIHNSEQRLLARGVGAECVVVVGAGVTAQAYVRAVGQETPCLHKVLGVVADKVPEGLHRLGAYDDVHDVLERYVPDGIVIALDSDEYGLIDTVLAACESTGIRVSLLPTYHEYLPSQPHISEQGGLPLVDVNRIKLDNAGYAFLKRAFDIVGSAALIVLTSPILLVAAVGTKLSSPGPVLFRQRRIGRGRKPFDILKFRSMRLNSTSDTAWTRDGDPRRTKFGAFMRRYSIDELPQLFNVLAGDMSLVGPRPEIPSYVEHFKCSVPLYMVRHKVRPGMTGWAQVNGLRGDTSIEKRVEYDLHYIENWSMLFDLRILAMTPFKGVVNKQESLIK